MKECTEMEECKKEVTERLNEFEECIKSIKHDIENLNDIRDDVAAMRDMLETWNNAKGFVATVTAMSKVIVWIGVTAAALAGIYHYFKPH